MFHGRRRPDPELIKPLINQTTKRLRNRCCAAGKGVVC
jgi:hypothetical protein